VTARRETRAAPAPVLRAGAFARGVDGLFLPPVEGVEILHLVARGTPEEAWARSFLDPAHVLPYAIDGGDLGPYPATEEILLRSDVHAVLAGSGAKALLLSASCTPATHAWARRHGVRLLMTDYAHQRRFEDKIAFDAFLRRHGIPAPRGGPVTLRHPLRLPVRGSAVVQTPASMGGEGTYFVDGAAGVEALVETGALRRGQRCLVRARVDGKSFGITVLVVPGRVALSAVRLQCYYPGETAHGGRVFAGVQWIPTGALPQGLRRRIDAALLSLGELLYRRRFFGFANVDFMVDARGRVLVIECNPRMSAATPQLLRDPALLSFVPAGELFLRGFLGPRRFPRSFERRPLPASEYQGATLDLVPAAGHPGKIARAFASGLYRLGAREIAYRGPDVRRLEGPRDLALFSFAREGQTCNADDTLATVVSNAPLYDEQGVMLPAARRVVATFRYLR
jgi:ATP-grasp domain